MSEIGYKCPAVEPLQKNSFNIEPLKRVKYFLRIESNGEVPPSMVHPGGDSIIFLFSKKRLPGVGSKPGSSRFHLFSHFHHFYQPG
jgi:hypothetical protein